MIWVRKFPGRTTMLRQHLMGACLAALAVGPGAAVAATAKPSLDQLWEIIQKQQQEIEALKARLKTAEERSAGTEKKVEATVDMVEQSQKAQQAAPSLSSWAQNTSIGSYGEANYNHYFGGDNNDVLDLRRVVLFLGHRFNDRIRFQSELELEHAKVEGGETSGEFAAEQAYLEFGLRPSMNLRAGLQLIPIGMLNETHEPTTFYSVERNEVETRIVPTTWRELAVGLQGEVLPGLEYNLGVSSSLDAKRFNDPATAVRSMRQEGFEANANDLAFYAGLNYRGLPGLLLGAGVFTGNTGQGDKAIGDAHLTLWDVHSRYVFKDLELRALYARGTLGDAANISFVTGQTAPSAFDGGYGEVAYHLWRRGDMEFVPFVRYSAYNTQQQVPQGLTADPNNKERVWTVGFAFYPMSQVVFKADYQDFSRDSSMDTFNLGIGYNF
jgi:hypothetical protein